MEDQVLNKIFNNCFEFKKETKGTNSSLDIFHVNLRNLRLNWTSLISTLSILDTNWDVILLTEISIKKNETSLYKLPNYSPFWVTREETKMGDGVAAFIKDTLASEIKHIKIDQNDAIEIQLMNNKKSYCTIIFAYRKPSSDVNMFIKNMESVLTKCPKKDTVIWAGDINIDILDKQSVRGNPDHHTTNKREQLGRDKYENCLSKLGFEKRISSITREEIRGDLLTQSCIDHFFVRSENVISRGATILDKLADHYITTLRLDLKGNDVRSNGNANAINTNTSQRNDYKIIKELKNIKWDYLENLVDSDSVYNEIERVITGIYERNTKMKSQINKVKKNSKVKKAWITDNMLNQIENKNKLWKKIKTLKTLNSSLISE